MKRKERNLFSSSLILAPLAALFVALFFLTGGVSGKRQKSPPPAFETDIMPILESNCALSGCHVGNEAWLGLDMLPEAAYGNLVVEPSREVPGLMRVKPFDPDSSYMVHKLLGSQSKGGRMPLKQDPLSREQIDLVIRWIKAGAPRLAGRN